LVFKRRERRSVVRVIAEALYPRGGWVRAFYYVRHRLRRLPDSPDRIARGIWAGVFTTFTPFYGLHFVIAGTLAYLMRGNILAALMATFFGNPATYIPIGVISLQTGHWLLGSEFKASDQGSFGQKFVDTGRDLKDNFYAIFTDDVADWGGVITFYNEIFYPYMIGGLIPGVITGTIAYFMSLPVIRAYKARRKASIKAKFEAIKQRAEADTAPKAD
jgi:uncharacterized protein (DUF2062 family)